MQPEVHGSYTAQVGKLSLWLLPPPATCSRATVTMTMVLGGFSLSTATQAHDVQLKGDLSPISDAGHTGVATTPSSTQAGPLSAFLGDLLHVSQHDGNRKSKLLELVRAFHSRQVLWLHRGWEVCAARACGRQRPASPPRNLGMRSRPLIRAPVQISPQTLTSVKSVLSYVRTFTFVYLGHLYCLVIRRPADRAA